VAGAQQLDCYNLALSYLDSSQRVQSLTEQSATAGACNTFWDRARKIVLEQCYWSFATRSLALALLLDQQQIPVASQLMPGWRFIYSRPVDCLKAQAVTTLYGLRAYPSLSYWWTNSSYQPNITGQFRPPWKEVLDYTNVNAPGQAIDIVTDQDSAWLVYTVDPPNFGILPEVFVDCVAWHLAQRIAGPVSANQKAKERADKNALLSLSRALAQNLNEEQPDAYPQSPSITARL